MAFALTGKKTGPETTIDTFIQPMKKIPSKWLALIIGAVIEIAFVAILLSFGSFGHFVPANLPTGLLLVTQIPGIIIAVAAGFLLP
jgi:hypothetical protein